MSGRPILCAVLILVASQIVKAEIALGRSLPELNIENKGELLVSGTEPSYQSWASRAVNERVSLLEYLPGHPSSTGLYKNVNDALKRQGYDDKNFHVAAIINMDEAIWGTQSRVVDEVVSRKKISPKVSFVIDADGLGREKWGLPRKSGAIVLVDQHGEIQFFQEGALENEGVSRLIETIDSLLNSDKLVVSSGN